eukprot:TRINITY_DN3260_c0_g1_i1.p1 TRINITY_DN3260_c0_g1~~TRINITY_DN3260_c0_g1_i1.p1  ORF type:complete len:1010 (-),score=251.87 TRINITY_DN3260_c0_g1_i1:132-3161(-)
MSWKTQSCRGPISASMMQEGEEQSNESTTRSSVAGSFINFAKTTTANVRQRGSTVVFKREQSTESDINQADNHKNGFHVGGGTPLTRSSAEDLSSVVDQEEKKERKKRSLSGKFRRNSEVNISHEEVTVHKEDREREKDKDREKSFLKRRRSSLPGITDSLISPRSKEEKEKRKEEKKREKEVNLRDSRSSDGSGIYEDNNNQNTSSESYDSSMVSHDMNNKLKKSTAKIKSVSEGVFEKISTKMKKSEGNGTNPNVELTREPSTNQLNTEHTSTQNPRPANNPQSFALAGNTPASLSTSALPTSTILHKPAPAPNSSSSITTSTSTPSLHNSSYSAPIRLSQTMQPINAPLNTNVSALNNLNKPPSVTPPSAPSSHTHNTTPVKPVNGLNNGTNNTQLTPGTNGIRRSSPNTGSRPLPTPPNPTPSSNVPTRTAPTLSQNNTNSSSGNSVIGRPPANNSMYELGDGALIKTPKSNSYIASGKQEVLKSQLQTNSASGHPISDSNYSTSMKSIAAFLSNPTPLPNLNNSNSNSSILKSSDSTSADADDDKNNSKMRAKVVEEFISTEESYVSDLSVICQIFLEPIKKHHMMDKPTIQTVFGNIESLYSVNSTFLASLKQNPEAIGKIFAENIELFMIYSVYCATQTQANYFLTHGVKEHLELQQYLNSVQKIPQCRQLDLGSFLIKPIQRICKYPLLLRELLKYTPTTHEDYKQLEYSYNKAVELGDKINSKKKESEISARMNDLSSKLIMSKSLVGRNSFQPLSLLSSGRKLLSEGPLTSLVKRRVPMQMILDTQSARLNGKKAKSSKEVGWYILFNDLFLWTKRGGTGSGMEGDRDGGRYKVKFVGYLERCICEDFIDDEYEHTFQIIDVKGEDRKVFIEENEEKKEEMKRKIGDTIVRLRSKNNNLNINNINFNSLNMASGLQLNNSSGSNIGTSSGNSGALNNSKEVVECQWEYVAQKQDELSIEPGDRLEVVVKDELAEGWWTCIKLKTGQKGFVPYNYLKVLS